ncbi:MAG: uroporphyrinogen-III C-methyltransferase [Haliea sp.]|jgi:uroporphyrin-III C-methyltransferase/precorrin-2 dehydrogenase/sirohydrochlorin ferrochelatase|nr:uroporphyrinogen-III C-methyltransferase [Haliea sp.]
MVKVVAGAGRASDPGESGKVFLVGAGPGDPELLTVKAYRLLQNVDVVVYDRLVSRDILDLVPRGIECLSVGKEPGHHCVPQDKINELIVALALTGKRVLRLKGGDPYVFGRGGEEAEVLVEEGIPFEVVPGITSAAGASTYCGIPLTHRDYAQSVTFATGHLKDDSLDLDWPCLARANSTVVIYMGMSNLAAIAGALVAHGRSSQTPVAIVRRATRPDQDVVVGTLDDIAERAAACGMRSPALIIVGEVVALHETLCTEECQPEPHRSALPLALVRG